MHNMCAKKRDIQQIEEAAKESGISDEYRWDFGDYVEASKYGYPKDYTYPYSELLKIAQQFKEEWGIK